MKTKALLIVTNQMIEVELGEVTVTGNIAVAYIVNWGKYAELNLDRPEQGWKIYPD